MIKHFNLKFIDSVTGNVTKESLYVIYYESQNLYLYPDNQWRDTLMYKGQLCKTYDSFNKAFDDHKKLKIVVPITYLCEGQRFTYSGKSYHCRNICKQIDNFIAYNTPGKIAVCENEQYETFYLPFNESILVEIVPEDPDIPF